MAVVYQGMSGKKYLVAEKIAGGGEGIIYSIEGESSFVAKIYKENKRTIEREQKLKQMVGYHLSEEQLEQVVWPQDLLYNGTEFIGYTMPRLKNNQSLSMIFSNQTELKERMVVAYNLCAAIDTVHSTGQVCGDLNPQNICVDLKTFRVTLVDTDSFHIVKDNKVYRCEVGLSDYIAPELQKKMAEGLSLKTAPLPTYTKETDLFALAVHVFSLLMNGCHPFACAQDIGNGYRNTMETVEKRVADSVVIPQPIENIVEGFFPFHQKKTGITYPIYAPSFDSLPENLQKMFIQTFEEGFYIPEKRVSAKEWMETLQEIAKNITLVECAKGHSYFSVNLSCPYCKISERITKLFGKKEELLQEEKEESQESWSSEVIKSKRTQTYTYSSEGNWIDDLTKMAIVIAVFIIIIGFGVGITMATDSTNYNSYNKSDVKILKKIIKEQRAKGAKVSEDLDSNQYYWNDEGRLWFINWDAKKLSGSISFSGLSGLETLWCSDNEIKELDISENTELKRLVCYDNKLKKIELSNNQELEYLSCYSNQIKSIDISNNFLLEEDDIICNAKIIR